MKQAKKNNNERIYSLSLTSLIAVSVLALAEDTDTIGVGGGSSPSGIVDSSGWPFHLLLTVAPPNPSPPPPSSSLGVDTSAFSSAFSPRFFNR